MIFDIDTKTVQETDTLVDTEQPHSLIVWDDDFNTFLHVTKCLQEVCGMTFDEGFNCANMIDKTGKCPVDEGSKEEMQLKKDKLQSYGLTCEVKKIS